jgi:cytochrome c biogenesis protein CcmG/thiol:disulfide interchange protein DsbE
MKRPTVTPDLRPLAVAGLLGLLLTACGEPAQRLQTGDPAPQFQIQTLDGRLLDFPADLKGKVVAVRFWADWCRFCKGEMNEIEPVYQQYREQGLEVIAINVGQSRRVAQRFVDKLNISYTIGLDEESVAARRYGVIGLPTTFFVDREGKVQRKILGESELETFTRATTQLL